MENPTNGSDVPNLNGNVVAAVSQDRSDASVKYLTVPVKRENDKKEYRVIKLANGFKALLIATPGVASSTRPHSPKADEGENRDIAAAESIECDQAKLDKDDDIEPTSKRLKTEEKIVVVNEVEEKIAVVNEVEEKMAACGLAINVGTFNDPRDGPGMAHFLERMIVVESEKHSKECDFNGLIKSFGGNVETHTECDQTKFKFVVPAEFLRVALDGFAQLFMNPHLNRAVVRRERQFVVLRENLTDDKLYEKLCRFRERHYRAHNMILTIEAGLPLKTLKKYVEECFASLPDDGLPIEYFAEFSGPDLLDTSGSQRIFEIKSINGDRKIELIWTIPSHYLLFRSNPLRYISWILCHKGKGSLLSFLRKKQWCLDIYSCIAKTRSNSSTYTQLCLSLVITEEGLKYWMNVVRAVYSFICMIVRDSAQQKRISNEIHKIEEAKFRLSEEPRPTDLFDFYKNLYRNHATGSDHYSEKDATWLKMCLDALTPENANVMIYYQTWDETKCDKVEPWFKMKYEDTQMLKSSVRFFKNGEPSQELHLPIANIFLTDDFTLIPAPADASPYPVKIYSGASSEIWYKHDTKFGLPECYMNFHFISPLPLSSPENAGMLDLFVAVLKQLIFPELYPATAAGFSYRIDSSDKGLTVEVYGCNQKLPLLMTSITRYIAQCPKFMALMTEDFKEVMNEQRKAYYNRFSNPGQLADDVRQSILKLVHWSTVDKHEALFRVNSRQFDHFVKHFDDRIYIQCLMQGNMKKEDVVKTVQNCVEMLHCGPLMPLRPRMRATEIPVGASCCRLKSFNTTDSQSVTMNYYQFDDTSIRWAVIIELLNIIIDEPFFEDLKVRKAMDCSKYRLVADTSCALGYTVTGSYFSLSTELIDEDIETFRKSFSETLNEMAEKELFDVKEALTKMKRATTMNLKDEVKRNWVEITSGMYIFDRQNREREAIRGIKIEDLRKLMSDRTTDGCNFRKLSVQVKGDISDQVSSKTTQGHIASGYNGKVKYSLKYLNNSINEENKKNSDHYITDIEEYKCGLNVLRLNNSSP